MEASEVAALAMRVVLQLKQEMGGDTGAWTWHLINVRLPQNEEYMEANTLAHALDGHMNTENYVNKLGYNSINGDVLTRYGFYEDIGRKYKKTAQMEQFEVLWNV